MPKPLPKVQRDSFHIAQRLRASAKDGTELTKQELLLAAEFIEAAYTVYLYDKEEDEKHELEQIALKQQWEEERDADNERGDF